MTRLAPPPVLLVVAKAPVPGQAKTRLAATVGDDAAADLAAASLLDTLAAAHSTGWPVVVALTGRLDAAARENDVRHALAGCTVLEQRGSTFGERLVAAHVDTRAAFPHAGGTVQIGMDTPQASAADLRGVWELMADADAVLGHATDGGWWALAVRDATAAECLAEVPMSSPSTGARTAQALRAQGLVVRTGRTLADVDTADDARAVAADAPQLRFAAAWRAADAVVGR